MQEHVTDAQVTEMLQMADLDKDGKINYEGKWRWIVKSSIQDYPCYFIFFSFCQSLHDYCYRNPGSGRCGPKSITLFIKSNLQLIKNYTVSYLLQLK